jgi:hypothetical protein
MHGPVIPGPDGRSAKAILIAFIDDATRRIVHAEFSTSEHSLAFEKGIRHILLAHGRIGRHNVDYPEKKCRSSRRCSLLARRSTWKFQHNIWYLKAAERLQALFCFPRRRFAQARFMSI